MQDLEKELEDSIGQAVEETSKPVPSLKPVPSKPASLTEQWSRLHAIDQELRKRVRQEKLTIAAEYDRVLVAINSDFDQRREDALNAVEVERQRSIQNLVNRTAEQLREHDLLLRQMNPKIDNGR